MKPPPSDIFIHTPTAIGFGQVGAVELTLDEVESLHLFHMNIALTTPAPAHDHHIACAAVFLRALQDRRRWRLSREGVGHAV